MSKAFTREDDRPEPDPPKPRPSPLPPGTPNYITPDGAERLKAELASGPADDRARELRRILDSAVVLEPPSEALDDVRFGAVVTVRTSDGKEARYRIVGVDETDVARGWISWISPVAQALLTGAAGDRVRAVLPSGTKELEILDVRYAP